MFGHWRIDDILIKYIFQRAWQHYEIEVLPNVNIILQMLSYNLWEINFVYKHVFEDKVLKVDHLGLWHE